MVIIRVGNLDAKVKKKDIIAIFGLNIAARFKETSVQVISTGETYALITVKDNLQSEILKLPYSSKFTLHFDGHNHFV